MGNYKKRLRCPTCNSGDLYKRIWSEVWKKKSRMKDKYDNNTIDVFKRKARKYRCLNCKNEFDIPLGPI